MNSEKYNIPPEAVAELEQGNKIEAIKIIREKTGLDLKQAKELAENYNAESHPGLKNEFKTNEKPVIPVEAIAELNKGNKIGAIKLVRVANNFGLKDAKELVEKHISTNPQLQQKFDVLHAGGVKKLFNGIIIILGIIALLIFVGIV